MAAPTSFSMTQLQGPVNRLGSRADGCFGNVARDLADRVSAQIWGRQGNMGKADSTTRAGRR